MTDLPPDRADKLARLKKIKQEMDDLKVEYDVLVQEAVVPMTEIELVIIDGVKYRVSKVAGSNAVYHYDVLATLPQELQDEITETKIKAPKLQQALATGRLDPDVAADLISYTPKTPYAKFDPIPE